MSLLPHPPYPILLVTASLRGGGAERAVLNLANSLDRSRFTPHLALFQPEGIYLEQLAPDVQVTGLQPVPANILQRNYIRLRELQRLLRTLRPALVMSVAWQVNEVVLLSRLLNRWQIPLVINEQIAPTASLAGDPQRRRLWPLFRRLYSLASHIVAISAGIAEELHLDLHISLKRITTIPNPLDLKSIQSQAAQPAPLTVTSSKLPLVITLGRLVSQKNHALLLQAAQIAMQSQPFDLVILGEGPLHQNLLDQADSLSIRQHVHLPGFFSNPFPLLAKADLFVLSSDYEGLANVILEAMALGKPILSTNCPYGPAEILDGGRYGMLVPTDDPVALAGGLIRLLQDPLERQRLSQLSLVRAQSYDIAAITIRYQDLFTHLIRSNPYART